MGLSGGAGPHGATGPHAWCRKPCNIYMVTLGLNSGTAPHVMVALSLFVTLSLI